MFAREKCRVKATGNFLVDEQVGTAASRDGLVHRDPGYGDPARMQAAFSE